MKKTIQLVCLIIFTLSACQPSGITFENAICIENISTINPVDGLKEHQTIIIKEGKIFQISPSKELHLSRKNTIIDGTGKFLIPGLWDAHVHFSYLEELAPSMLDLFLVNGITSVRDTGGEFEFVNKWKAKSFANPTTSPRLMMAGPLLDGIPNVYDGSDPGHPVLSVGLSSVEEVRNKVNELDSLGVDFLKAYEMLSPEQFKMITQLAREKGLKVSGHVPLSMDVISASNAGLNSMEHLRNLELSCASNADELLLQRQQLLESEKSELGGVLRSKIHQAQRSAAIKNFDSKKADEVLAVLAKNETWQIPTLTLSTSFANRPFESNVWQDGFKYLPESIENQWKMDIEEIKSSEVSEFDKEYAQWMMDMTGRIHDTGIEIMAGTDCPIFFLTPGQSLHKELEKLVETGLSPLEAIKAATLNPAKYFNLENELGSIKANMWADLVILDANPLENISNTTKINAVIKQGNLISRSQLDQILAKLSSN
ncbi:MAG: cytosine/adenosine deaminase-related metal-dependent hydrolase [Roseivirga sp.]|jgi:cytosine/adenosine deaminase-related metal-dependent hydrolase